MNSLEPKVAVVMAVYNGVDFLDRSIRSLIAQTMESWELICVDDGSTDTSVELIRRYADDDSRIRVVCQQNAGPPRARMAGYRAARSRYVFVLDQDDYLDRDCLGSLLEAAERTGADNVICDWLVEDERGKFVSFYSERGYVPGQELKPIEAFAATFPWHIHGICFWQRDLVDRVAVREEYAINNYDSDELLSRIMFLESRKIVVGAGKYFHVRNTGSMTHRPSIRALASLQTNERLLDEAIARGLSEDVQWRILLFQRNTLANRIRTTIGGRASLQTEEYDEAMGRIGKYHARLEERFLKHPTRRVDALLIVWKLRVFRWRCLLTG